MLVCPQCGFENPNANNFCQECGASLTQNTCPECGTLVSFDSVECQNCGATAGVIWMAIVAPDGDQLAKAASTEAAIPETKAIGTKEAQGTQPDAAFGYLDHPQRYLLLESLIPVESKLEEQQVRVLDCQPFQLSLLEAMIGQEPDVANDDEMESSDEEDDYMDDSSVGPKTTLTVPAIAQPYLALGGSFNQAIPGIHDAWNHDGQQVLLLEDRSKFPLLLDLWRDEELALPQLQLLHWLYEMAELWTALEPLNCQRTLLEINNLRIDEDQTLSLQRLYPNPAGCMPNLQDLGKVWQDLFTESQRTQFGTLASMLEDLEAGKIPTIRDLRSRIEAVARDLQPKTKNGIGLNGGSDDSPTIPPSEPSADLSDPNVPTHLEVPLEALGSHEDDDDEMDSDPTVVLPMQLFSLDEAGKTDIGRQRQHNEDYFGVETQITRLESPSGKTVHARNLYILCDGMGGQADGEVASAMAVDTLRRYFKDSWQSNPFSEKGSKLPAPNDLGQAVQLANKAIYDVNQQNARSGIGRMGTTLVMALIQDTEVAIAHVGDSRLYRLTRKRGLEQLTTDHEVGQREIQRGVDPDIAYARPDAYQLTQALGPRDENFVKPDVQYLELNEDTLLLLCSDGLSDNDLLETHYQTHLEPLLSSHANLDQGASKLIELANQHNGHDNITVILIRAKVRPNLAHLR